VLAQAGVDRGPVFLRGYAQIAQHYLPPPFELTDDPLRAVAIVVDPRRGGPAAGVEDGPGAAGRGRAVQRRQQVDRLLLHTCPP
jgi:hypothetical protein